MLLHEGGSPRRPALADDCPGLSGPLEDIVRRTSPDVDVFLTGHTHAAYNCVIDGRRVTSAASFGRLITRIELEIDRRTHDVVRARADNWVVGAGRHARAGHHRADRALRGASPTRCGCA